MRETVRELWRENRSFLVFLLLMGLFRSSLADWNSVPSSSMEPTIVPGDRILVNKLAYDLRAPLLGTRLMHLGDPERGDIVVFDSERSDTRLVKRVIGMPGETVALRGNRLFIADRQIPCAPSRRLNPEAALEPGADCLEALPGAEHAIRLRMRPSRLADFGPVRIPAGQYFVMGDNRDNSADSRVIGFVPREEIIGRARRVVLSFDYGDFYLPRAERWLHTL